ncbi:klhl36, partial [Symbiodinium sp. CCMP2456]
MAAGRIVQGFIELSDPQGLRQFAPVDFDWNQELGEHKHPPLFYAVIHSLPETAYNDAEQEKRLKTIECLLELGADPLRCTSSTLQKDLFFQTRVKGKLVCKEETLVEVSYEGQSTISFVMNVLGELRKGKGGADWTVACNYLESILALIKTTTAGKSQSIVVHQEVAHMWESFREMTSTHNVVFESSDGEVSAHDHVLMISSPVLKAMLESSMKEGSCRRIDIKDSSSRGISLFLDLLYTSSSAIADLDYKTMLVALDLAHRWQVQHIVDMLTNSLQQEINVGSFGEIAETATLKGIERLQRACITFGSTNADVQAMLQKNSFPPAVAKLMGMPEAVRTETTTSKRRRFSCKPMIRWVVDNLSLQADDSLIIIFNPSWMSMKNFMQEILADKDSRIRLVELPGPTRGAAETVLIGLQALPQELQSRPTLLADGDTFYTSDVVGQFRKIAATHNAVFCFHDTQPKPIYSYITMDDADNIKEVKEKVKISDWANTGCYCFRDGAELAKECE